MSSRADTSRSIWCRRAPQRISQGAGSWGEKLCLGQWHQSWHRVTRYHLPCRGMGVQENGRFPPVSRSQWDALTRKNGAQKRTRTSTPLRAPAPEAGASTNSAIWARGRSGPLAALFAPVNRLHRSCPKEFVHKPLGDGSGLAQLGRCLARLADAKACYHCRWRRRNPALRQTRTELTGHTACATH